MKIVEMGSATIPLEDYRVFMDIKKDFNKKLECELIRLNERDRESILRDRDDYIRRNERLVSEKTEAQEEVRETAEINVKLRSELNEVKAELDRTKAELDRTKAELDKAEKLNAIAYVGLDAVESEFKKRNEDEKTMREAVIRLRELYAKALDQRDRLLSRGLFARILNREC